MQSSLFPEEDRQIHQHSSKLVISKTASNISKAKSNFLKALEKNKKLKEKRDFLQALLDDTLGMVQHEIGQAEILLSKALFEELVHLDKAYNNRLYKFTKKRKEAFGDLIFDRAADLINEFDKNEAKEYLDKYKPAEYDDMMLAMKGEVRNEMKSMFGVDIDPDDFMSDDIDMEKMFERYGEAFEQIKNGNTGGGNRKRTKKQIESDEKRKSDEKLLDTDMQLLFRQLAVKLHPDKEPDEALKLEKEELMKKISAAREEQDIYELLRIRTMLSENDTSFQHEVFNDDSMLRLTKLIREKNKQVEMAIFSLQHDNFPLNQFYSIAQNEKIAKEQIRLIVNKRKKEMEQAALDITTQKQRLNNNSEMNNYIDRYIKNEELNNMLDLFDDDDDDHYF